MKPLSLAVPAGIAAALVASAALLPRFADDAPQRPTGEPPSALAAAAPALASDAMHAAIADLRRQLDHLTDENAELRRRVDDAAAPQARADTALPALGPTTAPAAPAPATRPSAPPSAEELAAADRAIADARESGFRSEPLDPGWSSATASKLQQAIAGEGDTPPLQSLECRSRTCRVAFGAAPGVDAEAFLPLLALRLAPLFGNIAVSMSEPGVAASGTVLYLSR